jgi:hypothetical protein
MRQREATDDLFVVPIESIRIRAKSRDDIPALLRGLQHLYVEPDLRTEVFTLLAQHVAPDRAHDNGRPGMMLWRILVLAVLKQGLDCDYDRLAELANEHGTLRLMLQHVPEDKTEYEVRTLKNNVDLLTPAVLAQVNDIVTREGLAVAGKSPGAALAARVDAFIVESNVHHPTDLSLLWDATRAALRDTATVARKAKLPGWRQVGHWQRQLRTAFNRVSRQRQWSTRPAAVKTYLRLSAELTHRIEQTVATLQAHATPRDPTVAAALTRIAQWVDDAARLRDQIERRVLQEERIPHAEKLFSVFERYTRWNAKGKAGRPVELGVPLTMLEDASGFVLAWQLQWQGGDVDTAVPVVQAAQTAHPTLASCSFDRGFHSPSNQLDLKDLLTQVTLPVKGKGNAASRAREATSAFQAARRQHPAVESAIHALECHGLGRIRNRGKAGFERTVALSILGANLHRLGVLLQQRARRRRKRLRFAA